ncbi:MAG: copper homeostasis protein [Mariniblastus sp.]|jgi:copper homeostasis protein
MDKVLVEVCTGSLEGARIAELSGADRIELNTALELDGLTPSAGLVQLVTRELRIPVIAMARPRAGDFCYTDDEWQTLRADVQWLLANGVDGIAFGCLDSNGQVDLERCLEIRDLAGSHQLVFHKAFDDAVDWERGLESLVEAGINRVMTSGQSDTVMNGLETLSSMVRQAGKRIEILPAGRVGSGNASQIVEKTGCNQLHGSFASSETLNLGDEIRSTIEQLARF